jgi:hypothetical protein
LKLDEIIMVDKMELHRETCEMVFLDLLQISSGMGRIQTMASMIEKQWKQEKVATRRKQTKINELEQCII